MSKKFLRPPPQDDDDDSDEDEEEQEELLDDDDDEDETTPKRTATVDANLSDSDDDDDEDEEEDDHDDRHRKKRQRPSDSGGRANKKSKASSFFDIEAEASDDDEEEGTHRRNNDDEQMDAEARELIRQQDLRRARAGGLFGERSAAEISKAIEQRHRMQNQAVNRSRIIDRPTRTEHVATPSAAAVAEDAPEVYTAAVAQQSLVPSVSDPSFWMVSCSNGKEQELVFQIMNKNVALARQGKPLGITGAIAAQSKGKVFIESFSEPAVLEAVEGVRGILQYTMRLVPIQDMTTVLTVVPKKKPVQKNEWVRMTRGHYKGDLALVKAVKESGLKCVVQCVPRLDLTLFDLPPEEARIRRRTVRPAKKFFNPQEVNALGRQTLRRQRFPGLDIYCDYFEGNYYHDGYLLKEMTVGSMIKPCSEEDPPTLDELQSFQRRKSKKDGAEYDDGVEENEGSKMAGSLLDELSVLQGMTGPGRNKNSAGSGLLIGDTVEVIEGDLIGMRGKLASIDGSTVKVKPETSNVDLGGTTEIDFLVGQVRKYISVGQHVKVTAGRYANETGVVVAVEQLDGDTDFTAVVLTDVTNKEISVRTSQLRESAEVASGQDRLSGYELYDLVVLSGGGSANEVGVIVRVGREDFTVINNHGIAREVRPEELRGKKNNDSNRAVALDVQGNQIRVGDTVNVAEGPHKGKSATIKRMSRAQLFLHSQTWSEHAGIFVVRSRSCVLSGSRAQNRGSAMDGGMSPFASPLSQNSRGGPAPGRGRRDDALIGKTVRIQAGQWKGYIGTVSDTTATHVSVELHSRLKKVPVVRERVVVVGDKFGVTENSSQLENNAAGPIESSLQTMATPMHAVGGATPAIHGFGGATPSHESGATDEVWRPGGSVDQDAVKDDDGWGTSETYNDSAGGNGATKDEGWGSTSDSWGAAPPVPKEEPVELPVPKQEARPVKHEQAEDLEDTPVWFMERVFVQMKGTDKRAVIREINADKSASVEMEEDKSIRTVRSVDVSMVPPSEHDTVLVTGGNEIGLEGSLVCVDGSDAILKDANDEFKIIDYVHLVKIAAEV